MRNSQHSASSSGQLPQQSFVRGQLPSSGIPPSRQQPQKFSQPNEFYNNSNNMTQQQQQTRMPNTVQQSSNIPTTTNSLPSVSMVPPQDGYYTIIQVRSAAEFYGLYQAREHEFNNLSKHLADYYNNATNDSLLNVSFFMEGALCVIQEHDKYHRVIIKHRESESRVSVKLVDRGDEIIVDISELLQTDNRFSSIPAFAQPFRLRGYDESQSSASITLNLKKLILNQRVQISQYGPVVNGFYPVEVTLNGNQSVNKLLFSNEKNLPITSSISNNRPNFNHSQPTHIESQVYSNSSRHHQIIHQDLSGRSDIGQRTNDVLPAPQKILTGPPRGQAGRFGAPPTNQIPSSNEQIPRFPNAINRNQQSQPMDSSSSSSNSVWNNDQNNKSNFPTQQPFGRQQSGLSQFAMNQRTDDNKTSIPNNSNRFGGNNSDNQQSSFEQKRSYGNAFSHDDRNERQTSGNNFQQNNQGTNDSGDRRGGFSNRRGTGGFSDRGSRGGNNDRNTGRNNEENNENNFQSSGGYAKRPGGFPDRGARGGGNFQDRTGSNRNQGDDYNENNMQRSQNYNSNRGGGFRGGRDDGRFQNRRDQGGNGDSGQRRGLRGGGRGGFRDRNDMDLKLSSDNNNSTKTFSGWPATQPTPPNFEAGEQYPENVIPKDAFKFVVSHVETANDFFIQLLSKRDEITELTETLQIEYKQSPERNLSLFKKDQACLVKHSDGCWYRAIVLSIGVSKLTVRFIDFGDTTDVNANTIRQIAKKYCSSPPYAYQCTFENAQIVENVIREHIINKCVEKEFNGKIPRKTSDGKYLLESDDFRNILLEINAIKLEIFKPEIQVKRTKCLIGHIESEQQEFYIQDDEDTLGKIAKLIENEEPTAPILSNDELAQLELNTIVLASYEDEPFRGIITQSNQSDENLNICFVDYGNTSTCPKNSFKRCSQQLSSYPHQAKHCHLYGISSNEINNALKYLSDNSDPDNTIEFSIIKEKDQIYDVLIYINNQCINEKFGYDQSNIKPEEEQPEKTNEISLDTSVINKPETEDISTKSRQALLTYIEKSKPYVYLQLIPESESILDRINELIETITQENKHNSSYEIGQHIIAKFTDDDNYYRARIESYSSSSQFYTVYFLDYGNLDTNVPIDHLYSYSDDLDQIEPQARGYLLDQIDSDKWENIILPLVEDHLNDIIEFYFIDESHSIIHLKSDEIYDMKENIEPIIEDNQTFQANIIGTDNDCFYIHILPDGNLQVCEMEEIFQTCDKQHKDTWTINDLCIVSNEEKKYYRGKILAIHDEKKYDIKCIDYGNILQNITDDHLYVLPDDDIFKQSSLAYQCQLVGIDEENQIKAIEEIIKNIQPVERVTITVDNDRNDQCLFVTLIRENNEIVNERYVSNGNDTTENENKQESDNDEKNEIIIPNSSDTPNNDEEQLTSQTETPNNDDKQLTPQTETPNNDNEQLTSQTETPDDQKNLTENPNDQTNLTDNNSVLSITNNQTIDFGENDPSTTIKDETNNSISSN